jgi:transcriptional regulator with XRE-family HTH domain
MGDNQPFKVFGARLRKLREQARESLLEVSGAIEIDEKTLLNYEAGIERPDEDILMLLINHFDISESDAVKLWELAGYTKDTDKQSGEEQLFKQIMMVIPFDNRINFTDVANIDAKATGVVITFGASAGNVQPQTVTRVGMSLEQASILAKNIQKSIDAALQPKTPKALPAPKNKTDKKKHS